MKSALLLVLGIASFTVSAAPPVIGGCNVMPANNPWNTPVDEAPVDPLSDDYIANINAHGATLVHPDFGSNIHYGIPWITVEEGQPDVPIDFRVKSQSDPGPYPIPDDAPIEGAGQAGDRHVLVIDKSTCILYEMYASKFLGAGLGWKAYSGAVWDLDSNKLRPNTWTSADAAGLPILPGLARCAEAESGQIDHAFRFTVERSQHAFIYPASHYASDDTGASFPPMGLRLRLKAGYNLSSFTGQARAIALALKKYGMILADNGSNWYINGETNHACWKDNNLNQLKTIPGTAFEVVVSPPPPSDFAGDLLANGGFEAGRVTGNRPGNWTAAGKATRACDNPPHSFVADSGQCMLKLLPSGGTPTRAAQTLDAVAEGNLELHFRARTFSVPAAGAVAAVTFTYADDTTKRFAMDLPAGSQAHYQSFVLPLAPTKPVDHLVVSFTYPGATGHLSVDQVALLPP